MEMFCSSPKPDPNPPKSSFKSKSDININIYNAIRRYDVMSDFTNFSPTTIRIDMLMVQSAACFGQRWD